MLKTIVISWPYSKEGRLNTFMLFDSPADFNKDNLGATYDDFLEGNFWSRRWSERGEVHGTIEKEFGILAIESKSMRVIPGGCGEAVYPIGVNILNPENCLGSRFEVDFLNEKILRTIIEELKTFERYEVTYSDATVQRQWLSPSLAIKVQGEAGVSSVSGPDRRLEAYVPGLDRVEVFKTYFGIDEIRSAAFEIDIQTRDDEVLALNYDRVETRKIWKG